MTLTKRGKDWVEGYKQGALDALNSVEFRQSLLQAKVTELKFMFEMTKKKYGVCIFTKDLEKRMEELEKGLKK